MLLRRTNKQKWTWTVDLLIPVGDRTDKLTCVVCFEMSIESGRNPASISKWQRTTTIQAYNICPFWSSWHHWTPPRLSEMCISRRHWYRLVGLANWRPPFCRRLLHLIRRPRMRKGLRHARAFQTARAFHPVVVCFNMAPGLLSHQVVACACSVYLIHCGLVSGESTGCGGLCWWCAGVSIAAR